MVTDLSVLLQGKALDVYALMPREDTMDYDKLKRALLQRYQLTEKGFKRRHRQNADKKPMRHSSNFQHG